MNNNRAYALDALRGYAIITMVLSAQIASGILPSWMYHAQVPPPLGVFNPDVFGITWVDLVFPFFLFAMGAAFPLSIGKKIEKGVSRWPLCVSAVERCLKLTFFAIFICHLYPWSVSSPQDMRSWVLAISAFVLLFPMFMRLPFKMPEWTHQLISIASIGVGFILMMTIKYTGDRTFSMSYSNIIILVLANMALFGSVIYMFTVHNRIARIAILPFIMAILLGGTTDGSWNQAVLNYSPIPWLYNFKFLKYLFIIIPGSIAGQYIIDWMKCRKIDSSISSVEKRVTPLVLILCVALIVFNLWGLFTRHLVVNLLGTASLLAALHYSLRGNSTNIVLWRRLFTAGAYLLLLGLFFEAFEGGIRKDYSTFSYYFTTAGLAFFALTVFSILCDIYRIKSLTLHLEMAGQNPMIAYVATNLLIMPLLHILGLNDYLDMLCTNPWLGFLRGVIVTSLAVAVAMFFTKIKWFWRT